MRNVLLLTTGLMALCLMACTEKNPGAPEADAKLQVPVEVAAPKSVLDPTVYAKKLAEMPPPYNTADIVAGEKLWVKCASCHSVDASAGNGLGPNLHSVFGRVSGTAQGYSFSEAMKTHGTVWELDNMNAYLAAPSKVIPGNKMTFAGIKSESDRLNLVAWLKVTTSSDEK